MDTVVDLTGLLAPMWYGVLILLAVSTAAIVFAVVEHKPG